MRYEIIEGSNKGVLVDRTPIMQDVKDTFEVSFLLPDNDGYMALFRGEAGVEYKKTIRYGKCVIPKELFAKEQYVEVIVIKLNQEQIVGLWKCEPIKITAFLNLRQSQWQVSGGADDKDCYTRLVELEMLHSQTLTDFMALKADKAIKERQTAEIVASFRLELYKQGEVLGYIQKENTTLTEAYNKAIEVINDLSKRVVALEKNYDPTLIK